jgi:hypothetical protein
MSEFTGRVHSALYRARANRSASMAVGLCYLRRTDAGRRAAHAAPRRSKPGCGRRQKKPTADDPIFLNLNSPPAAMASVDVCSCDW